MTDLDVGEPPLVPGEARTAADLLARGLDDPGLTAARNGAFWAALKSRLSDQDSI